jgi:ferredoxin
MTKPFREGYVKPYKPIKTFIDPETKEAISLDPLAKPECGKDLCFHCGACLLDCMVGHPCEKSPTGKHEWKVPQTPGSPRTITLFTYRCKLCGTVFTGSETEAENAWTWMIGPRRAGLVRLMYHECDSGRLGIAELVGCQRERGTEDEG